MQKQLLITFDYELFLGKLSGSVDDCMIHPTQKLMKILQKYKANAVFFVDSAYLLRLKEMSASNAQCLKDFNKIADQLCVLVAEGHYVYPHIHSHWLDAVYIPEKNQWQLTDTRKYRFHNISINDREKIFNGSIHLLKSIIHQKFPDYQIDAHRAGGWCIQPFTDFKPFYELHHLKYDFSVMGGFYQFTEAQFFDFSNAPRKNIYRFQDDVCIETGNGPFIQFNINTIEIQPAVRLFNKIWLKYQYKILKDHTFNRGIGQQTHELEGIYPASPNGKNFEKSHWERIAVELMTPVKLKNHLQFLEKNQYMHFISHPKMITRNNLSIFDKFLEKVFNKYSVETDFHLMIP